MVLMAWSGAAPAAANPPPSRLGPAHATRMVELAGLTHPGPFGERNLELGDYFGFLEEGRLVAMAGERLECPPFREISAVCTHPDFQRRGLARRLMEHLIVRELGRGEIPILHVLTGNLHARALYEKMGFRILRKMPVRVVQRSKPFETDQDSPPRR